jgi:hypothetical protein
VIAEGMRASMVGRMRGGILCLAGLLIAGFGGVLMMLGGYIGFGEAMSKPARGLPYIVGGAVGALAGIAMTAVAVLRLVKRRPR